MATDAWRAVGPQLQARPGGSVLVFGGATPVIGIYAAALAHCLGAGRVVYVDGDETRRTIASEYGVWAVENLETVDQPTFDIVVDAAGDTDTLLDAIRACGPAGQLTSIAPSLRAPALPMLEMYYRGLTYRIGRPNCRHGHGPALTAWSGHGFRPERVGPKLFAYDDAIEAWLDAALYVAVER